MATNTPKNNKTASLSVGDKHFNLPIRHATLGNPVIDITGLKEFFTFDPSFMATAACESKITYIDGNQGVLLHRGYPIEQLAEKADYLEVAYLLLHGELPTLTQKTAFTQAIAQQYFIPEKLRGIFSGFAHDAHPMAMLVAAMGGLSAYYPQDTDFSEVDNRLSAGIALIAKIPTLAAMCYQRSTGLPFAPPQSEMGYTENFLSMLFAKPLVTKPIDAVLVRAIDRMFILHADHEQNASTSTVRLTGSTGANPYACVSAGIAALSGTAHGGANEACLNMLYEIGEIKNIPAYIKRAKDKTDPFRLVGFGHRVYKNYDPRAKIMRQTCHEVLEKIGLRDAPLFKLAMELERIALEDDYFIERKLYPNIDFYSGLTLNAIGIPSNLFTVIFALARTSGWVSQWHEMLSQRDHRIGRPRQLYTGSPKRDFITITDRIHEKN